MKTPLIAFPALAGFAVLAAFACSSAKSGPTGSPAPAPAYYEDGRLSLPENYREWVYLSTGFDMSYSPMSMPGHHMFDNVFVEPSAYKVFIATGTWPDKTMLVLEVRGAKDKGSINKNGNYQDSQVMGREVHVKDTARFPDSGWAFFGFDTGTSAKMIPRTQDCYSCHAQHAAVDNTFVQFYPTLLPIATAKGTLSPGYKAESAKN
jgi:Cytochrome P460